MKTYRVALIPGDGVGREVIPEAQRVLHAAAQGFSLSFQEFDWGCQHYLRTGRMMPEDGLEQLQPFDAIVLGAVGHPSVPDSISLRRLLLRIRFGFDLYVNLRPVEILPGIEPPLRNKSARDINMLFIRENTEGEYAGLGGRFKRGTAEEVAIQQAVFTRRGIERVVGFAFEKARERPRKRLASPTKSNALEYSMVLWDEVVREVAREYPDAERPSPVRTCARKRSGHSWPGHCQSLGGHEVGRVDDGVSRRASSGGADRRRAQDCDCRRPGADARLGWGEHDCAGCQCGD